MIRSRSGRRVTGARSARLIALAALSLAAAGCKKAPAPPTAEEKQRTADIAFVIHAKSIIADKLRDPESARFRRLTLGLRPIPLNGHSRVLTLCGEVNGKNAYGAYARYDHFSVIQGFKPDLSDEEAWLTGEHDAVLRDADEAIHRLHCDIRREVHAIGDKGVPMSDPVNSADAGLTR